VLALPLPSARPIVFTLPSSTEGATVDGLELRLE
jgi:hypothetical protein